MEIRRDLYLNQLIDKQWNGQIKVVTGIRRCGKSYLLFKMFVRYLVEQGVGEDHLIRLQLDDYKFISCRQPENLYRYVTERIVDDGRYYVLIDEVQKADNFVDVLNGFLHIDNVDVYVTGSNSKFLSTDIATEFGDRGDEIRLYPLTFSEFFSAFEGDAMAAWRSYSKYGGMPLIMQRDSPQAKEQYLKNLFQKVFIKDIVERYGLRGNAELNEVTNVLASSIGSLVNPLRIANTIQTVKGKSISQNTVDKYLDYLEDSFLVSHAIRFDVKGRRYIGTPMKYYFTDIGLRNARLNFRQQEEEHIMENVIYNELLVRGFSVDVGVVETSAINENHHAVRRQTEVDFVANKGSLRLYIQSAAEMPTHEKMQQEQLSLKNIDDSFRKILIQKEEVEPWYNDDGILTISLFDFLLHPELLG